MNNMNDISKLPYVEWLEDTLREITSLPVESICVITKLQDGSTYASYSENTNMNDMLIFSGRIQQEAMMEMMHANGFLKDDEE